jgi:HPt (histidine-containing phosphotransfer) domain-containing protein
MNIRFLADDLGLDEKELRSIFALFIETSRSDLAAIKDAVPRDDSTTAARAAHSLKGAAASLGLSGLSDAAREIEEKSRDGRLQETSGAARTLEDLLAAAALMLAE